MQKAFGWLVILSASLGLTFSLTQLSAASAPAASAPEATRPPADASAPSLAHTLWGVDPLVELPAWPGQRQADGLHRPQNFGVFDGAQTWSQLVFQSYRDGNWEIYLADGAGQNPVRLTADPATDAYPNLNLSIGRIVFASRRDGDYEIFSMNLNGGDLRQLTFNTVTDIYPVWSPNGESILYQSYPGAVSEIYKMQADGSHPVALTNDGQGSINPSWSGDGTKVIFGAYRSGQYAIWRMNADGSGPTQIGAAVPYARRPFYSPDGNSIAFSADGTGDGFLELWVMNADGSQQFQLYNIGGQWDTWMSGWSPTVNGSWYPQPPAGPMNWIGFTAISYIYYQGVWYWDYGYPRATRQDCGACVIEQVVDNGVDWHASWSYADTVPPVATLAPLSTYGRCTGTPIRWDGYDRGQVPTGVLWYFVEYRVADGPWTPWLQVPGPYTPTITEEYFTGECGNQVSFRVRAEDFARLTSTWTPDHQAPATWLFSTLLTSTVRDARGWLIPTATLAITPTPVGLVEMFAPGHYLARLPVTGTTTMSVTAPGYGVWPLAVQDHYTDTVQNFDLPPLDDLIQNGNFEIADGGLNHWAAEGDIVPTAVITAAHLGQAAASLEAHIGITLSAGELLTTVTGINPQIATTSDGTLHLAVQNANGIAYTRRDPLGQWSTPVAVTTTAATPSLAVTLGGDVHLAWSDGSNVFHTFQPAGGSWAAPEQLVAGLQSAAAFIAPDDHGGIHLVYYHRTGAGYDFGGNLVYRYRAPDGTWQAEEAVVSAYRLISEHLQLTSGPNDSVRLMARYHYNEGHLWQCGRFGAWTCYLSDQFYGGEAHRLKIDDQGAAHLLWRVFPWAYHRNGLYSRQESGTWGVGYATQAVPGYTGLGDMALDETNSLYVLEARDNGVLFQFLPEGGGWSDIQTLETAGSGQPAIALDSSGTLHLIYETTSGQLWYRHSLPPQPSAYAALGQALSIPADLHHPTLSFHYQLQNDNGHTQAPFSVWVSTGVTETPVYSASASTAGWTRGWADVSEWAGQTVTVTFRTETVDAPSDVAVLLDGVSLGAWLTPVLQNVAPSHVEALVSSTITLTGQNFLNGLTVWAGAYPLAEVSWVNETTVTATVPGTLPPGIYPVWVINPGGQAQVLPFSLHVGQELFLPLINRHSP